MKTVLYYLLLLTTAVRFVDMVYLLISNTNLPVPVIVVSAVVILYGLLLVFWRFIGQVKLRQLRDFYIVQAVLVLFNLSYISMNSPLPVSFAETILVGSFLDLVISAGVVYSVVKKMRSKYRIVPQVGQSHV